MGTTSQQFCLKWNNHSSNMLNVFETLLTSEQLVDVTLACDGLSLKAHKMVLSACSPFFQSLFQENPCKHPIVILKDIRYADLKAIIDFMYKGEVNVGQAHLSALLKTAETLKVKGLAEVSGEDGQSSSGSVVQQEVPVYPQAQHSSDVANIVQTIDSSVRPSSDSPTGRKRKRTKWKNRGGQSGGGNDSETDDQGPAAKNQEIVSADVIEDDSSSIGVVDGPSDTRNAKDSRIIIEEATIVGDYVEPAALMEQNMTTDNVQPVSSQLMLTNATSKDNNINVPESRSYDTTVATMNPETVDLVDRPEDVKPTALVSYEEPPMSPNATSSHHSQDDSNSMTMYMDPNSMPAIAGPSNYQQDKQPSASAGQGQLVDKTTKGPDPHPIFTVTKDKSGQDIAVVNGFIFRKKNTSKSNIVNWMCDSYNISKCSSIFPTKHSLILRWPTEHNHLKPEPIELPQNIAKITTSVVRDKPQKRKANAAEFILDNKGRQRAIYEGFVYLREGVSKSGTTYWHCKGKKEYKCPSRLSTIGAVVPTVPKQHNHEKPLNFIEKEAETSINVKPKPMDKRRRYLPARSNNSDGVETVTLTVPAVVSRPGTVPAVATPCRSVSTDKTIPAATFPASETSLVSLSKTTTIPRALQATPTSLRSMASAVMRPGSFPPTPNNSTSITTRSGTSLTTATNITPIISASVRPSAFPGTAANMGSVTTATTRRGTLPATSANIGAMTISTTDPGALSKITTNPRTPPVTATNLGSFKTPTTRPLTISKVQTNTSILKIKTCSGRQQATGSKATTSTRPRSSSEVTTNPGTLPVTATNVGSMTIATTGPGPAPNARTNPGTLPPATNTSSHISTTSAEGTVSTISNVRSLSNP